jgi:hypothetical protein
MRSICVQAARYWEEGLSLERKNLGGEFGYTWIVTDAEIKDRALKETAKQNLIGIQEMIHGAIRTREIQRKEKKSGEIIETYEEGDKQSYELFIKIGKKIEFIAPYKGPGARFVMTDDLLRYFVLSLIPPGKRMTLSSFQERLFQHYGIAISEDQLNRAILWTHEGQGIHQNTIVQKWMDEKLRAVGFLIPLSDDVSLVENPFVKENPEET